MSKTLRKIGLSLIIVAYVVVVVIFMLRDHKKDISSALSQSLDFIGTKLNAMVADSPDKEAAVQAYEDFKKQVLEQKIPPEQVEKMTADILNLSHNGVVISPEEAKEMIRSSFVLYSPDDSSKIDSLAFSVETIGVPDAAIYARPRKQVTPEDLERLNIRLNSIYSFEQKMSRAIKNKTNVDLEISRNIYYDFQDGIKLFIDPQSRTQLIKDNIAELEIELKNLEKEELLVSDSSFVKQLRKEKQKLERELQLIIRSKQESGKAAQNGVSQLNQLETIKKLRLLGIVRTGQDTLKQIIAKITKEASGIAKTSSTAPVDSVEKK